MGKKILVTGGAGFIGSHLCSKLLDRGCWVVSLDNFNDFYSPQIKRNNILSLEKRSDSKNFSSFEVDIRNRAVIREILAIEKPDAVIHLAAMAGVRPSIENPLLYNEVNILGTQHILDACVENQIRHFLFASSSSVYGNNPKIPFAEADCVDHPISPYAASKKAGELLCHAYSHLFQMAISCLRFFTVYGPGQRPDLAIHKFTKLISQGKPVPVFGKGNTERDYTYIDDIVDGIWKALVFNFLQDKKSFEIFNLGGSETISLTQMLKTIEIALGKEAERTYLPEQPGDVQRTWADLRKSHDVLGYQPKTVFSEGVSKFVQWFLICQLEEILL